MCTVGLVPINTVFFFAVLLLCSSASAMNMTLETLNIHTIVKE